MGKKRIVKKGGSDGGVRQARNISVPKRKLDKAILHVDATYNNTKVLLTDQSGEALVWSSSGALGFKGAKKGTPFAAAQVGELVGEKAKLMGVKDASVIIRGVGSGRESAVRGFISKGITLDTIEDRTPVAFNGPKPPKPRRV